MPQNEQKKTEKNGPEQWSLNDLDEEAKHNLLGFYALLLKIDMRNNPQLYKNANNRNPNNTD